MGEKMQRQMNVEKSKISDMFSTFDVREFWFPLLYKRLNGLQVLRMVGALYHEMVGEVDPRRMSDSQLRFVRMIMNMPGTWKHEILVQETWGELTELLPENLRNPTDPAEVKATWPRGQRKERIKLKPCSGCGKFTPIGCTMDDSGVRLCKKCCYQHGLDSTKTRLWEKSQVQLFNGLRSKLGGHQLGIPQIKTIQVEFRPKLPFRAPFTREVEENGIKTTQMKLFVAQKWAKAITIELNSTGFYHKFPKYCRKQCLATDDGAKNESKTGTKKGRNEGSDTLSKGNESHGNVSYVSNGKASKIVKRSRRFKLLKKGKHQLGSLSEPLKKGRKRVKATV